MSSHGESSQPTPNPWPPDAPRHFAAAAVAFEGALGLVAIALGWLFGHDPRRAFGDPHAPVASHLPAIGWGLLATVPMFLGLLLLDRLQFHWLRRLRWLIRRRLLPMFANLTMGQLVLISLMAGVGEELLFRGLLQDGLSRWLDDWLGGTTGAWIALGVASLLFGVCHFLTFSYFLLATLMGFYFGWLMIITKDLATPITTHAAYDFLALWYLTRTYRRKQ